MTHDKKIQKIKNLVAELESKAIQCGMAHRDQDASSGVTASRELARIRKDIKEKLDWL